MIPWLLAVMESRCLVVHNLKGITLWKKESGNQVTTPFLT